jgi:hypothetical protein
MTFRRVGRMVAFAVTPCCVTLGPAAAASASAKSIEVAIASYGSKIQTAEENVSKAVKEYETSKDPTGVEAAIAHSSAVLGSLRSKVVHQSPGTRRVKRAKAKIVQGLQTVISGYGVLSKAYEEKAASPEAASTDAANAFAPVKQGKKESWTRV